MKAVYSPLLIILSLFITISCKSDDDATTPVITNADLIVGSWNMSSNTVDDGNATASAPGIPIPITADFTWEGKDYDYQLIFDEDNNVGESGGFTVDITYSAIGLNQTQEVPLRAGDDNGDLLLTGEYAISENQLAVVNDGQTVNATIDELTETTLRLSIDIAELSPEILGDMVENARGTNKITFIKQ